MLTRRYAKKRRATYFGKGNKRVKVSRLYVSERNRLILGLGRKRKQIKKRQRGKGWTKLIAQGFDRGLKKYLGK